MPRVYLETSFISACVWDRTDPKSAAWTLESRQWWVNQRMNYELFASAEVVRELSAEGFRGREDALALVRDLPLLDITDDVRGLAKILVRERVMPGPEDAGDAIHVALAVIHRVDYVVTWNQRHLANRNKLPHLREVCRRAGYVAPELTTPEALWLLSDEEEP